MTRRDSLVTITTPTAFSPGSSSQNNRLNRSTRLTPHINLIDTGQQKVNRRYRDLETLLLGLIREEYAKTPKGRSKGAS